MSTHNDLLRIIANITFLIDPTSEQIRDGIRGRRGGAPPAAKSAIEALETFEVASSSQGDCAVCTDAMVMGEIGKKLPCGHCYHESCILQWLRTRNSCPLCRFQLQTDDAEYESKRRRE
ncbi:E3 ubiquitin-protein ligase CIP8-like [Eutrema salsugineum]|uniref:E3 ubiquitin-protein ligase CIP8-like n=1 Tax=Eutrema salsugineum TaxID=72664 RepID=UPI000CED5BAF|nr:E3 ubiquitin-protein ligase CIP8-like [Eutrema salsugineum]